MTNVTKIYQGKGNMQAIALELSAAFESHCLVLSFGGGSTNSLPEYYNSGSDNGSHAGERPKR